MKFFLASVLAISSLSTTAHAGLFSSSQCSTFDKRFAGGSCALAFKNNGCKGDMLPISDDLNTVELSGGFYKDISSIVVREGCAFRGYYTSMLRSDKEVTLIADSGNLLVKDLDKVKDQDDMDDKIKSYVCTCSEDSNQRNRNQGLMNRARNSLTSVNTCVRVPNSLCAIAYDETDCDKDDWDAPLDIPVTNKMDLGRFNEARESIESVSVRRGCVLTLHDEGNLNTRANWAAVRAPRNTDLHLNLKDSRDSKIRKLADDIESMKCSCPGGLGK